ncbi:Tfp pilus assembly protein PilV [Paraburkholderia kururiensis]
MRSIVVNSARRALNRGTSLIEVMLAVALTAVSALGLMATQLWIARHGHDSELHERAALIADAVAESTHSSDASDAINRAAVEQWKRRGADTAPGAAVSVLPSGNASVAMVVWPAIRNASAAGQIIDPATECGAAPAPLGMACVAIAFAQ